MFFWPCYVVYSFLQDEWGLRRYPTFYNQMGGSMWHGHLTRADNYKIHPNDRCFTTRIGNVNQESIEAGFPRALDGDKIFPLGTRVSWVTWEPVYPEDNELENENYGNGPGKNMHHYIT